MLSASEFVDNEMDFGELDAGIGSKDLIRTFLELCRVLAVVISGLPSSGEDSIELREQSSADMLQKHATLQIKAARQKLKETWNVKRVCSITPSYLVPVFSIFKMCSTACAAYGWGKRKQTKKVSLAMAEFAQSMNEMIQDMMVCIRALPESDAAGRSSGR